MAIKKRNRLYEQFNARTIRMMESPAYRVLSLSAHRVIDRICIEHAHHGGTDNGKLPVTYENFVEYGIHRHAIAPAIREAVALGFIEVTEQGRMQAGEFRSPSLYRVTFIVSRDGMPTDEWQKIQTMEEAEMIARQARMPVANSKSRCRKTPISGDGFRHRNSKSPVMDSITTVPVMDSVTAIYISGRVPGRDSDRGPFITAPSSVPN